MQFVYIESSASQYVSIVIHLFPLTNAIIILTMTDDYLRVFRGPRKASSIVVSFIYNTFIATWRIVCEKKE